LSNKNLKEVLEMRKFYAVAIALMVVFFGISVTGAFAQISHGFEDMQFAADKPWTNVMEHGKMLVDRGKQLKEMGEKMMRDGEEGQKTAVLSDKQGVPGGPQYLIATGKQLKEMGEKMIKEGEHMISEAQASLWKEGVPGAKPPAGK
jgi:hypothetical protein